MTLLNMYPTSINERYLDIALEALRCGELVIYPTDTLYALGCNALDNRAIERLCKIKNLNPAKTNLSIICCDISQASEYCRIDNRAYRILRDSLPGPFTFLLPAAPTLPKVFKGRKVVGLRVPDNPIATALARGLGNPVLTTSASWAEDSDDVEAMEECANPESIARHYEDVASVTISAGEGGYTGSTVVDLTDSSSPVIVRQGAGTIEL